MSTPKPPTKRRGWYDAAQILEWLKAAAVAAGGHGLSREDYDLWRASQPGRLASGGTITTHYGSWIAALHAAGIEPAPEQLNATHWPRQVRLDAIRAAAADKPGLLTRFAYQAWRDAQPDPAAIPSAVSYTPEMWDDLCRDAGVAAWSRPVGECHSDEQICETLRRCHRDLGGNVTKKAYRGWYAGLTAEQRVDAPYFITVITRFGSWTAACKAAGVPAGRREQWTEDEVTEVLARAIAEVAPERLTRTRYVEWLEANPGAPSLWVLSTVFGTFSEAVSAAA